jgi:heme exporter protein A
MDAFDSDDAPLAARGLSCRRGGRLLFSGFDLELRPGQAVWLRGDNGRGKTSLLRLLAGLVEPDAGDVRWFGRTASAARTQVVQPLYIAHANALKDDLRVHEALVFLATLSNATHAGDDATLARAVDAALERMGLARIRDALVRTLSQGQRRRAALARLGVPSRSVVWLLDEPYDALDQTSTAVLDAVLCEHTARGGCIVLTSHQPLGDGAPAHEQEWLRARTSPSMTGASAAVAAS